MHLNTTATAARWEQCWSPASPGLAVPSRWRGCPGLLPAGVLCRRARLPLRGHDSDGLLSAESPVGVSRGGAQGRRPWTQRLQCSSRTRTAKAAASPPLAALSLRERGAAGSTACVPYRDMTAPTEPRPRKLLPNPAHC